MYVLVSKWKSLSRVQLFASPWTIQSMHFSRPEYWSGWPFPSPGDLPNLGIEPRSPALQADSLPAEPQGNPKNTGVGSLSLLQRIFPTQDSNWGLLHCRRIFYQLSYQWILLTKKYRAPVSNTAPTTAAPARLKFNKIKNSIRQSHWPHFKCCLLYWTVKLQRISINSEILTEYSG